MRFSLPLLTALLLAPLAAQAADALTLSPVPPDATFSQIAQPSGFSPEMPKLSEVCMRLFRLDQKGVSPERMLAAGEEFHITRGPNNGVRPYPAGGVTRIASFRRI
jgi:hypothetical protein